MCVVVRECVCMCHRVYLYVCHVSVYIYVCRVSCVGNVSCVVLYIRVVRVYVLCMCKCVSCVFALCVCVVFVSICVSTHKYT